MIESFSDKETERLFDYEISRRIPVDLHRRAIRALRVLHRARNLQDLAAIPAYHLEKLKGDREGQHSIRINQRWRLCFRWKDGNAYDVKIVDYH